MDRVMDKFTHLFGWLLIGLWAWGALSYLGAGQVSAAFGALLVPPIGVLHALGLIS